MWVLTQRKQYCWASVQVQLYIPVAVMPVAVVAAIVAVAVAEAAESAAAVAAATEFCFANAV